MEVGTCRVYAADESIAPLRLVCIPVSECDVDNSPLNCSGRKFYHFLSVYHCYIHVLRMDDNKRVKRCVDYEDECINLRSRPKRTRKEVVRQI